MRRPIPQGHCPERPAVPAAFGPLRPRAQLGTPLGNRLRPASSARLSSVPFAEQSFDVTLMEEQVVVAKPIVPRERIRVRKDIVTGEQAVADTVRKGQVELQPEPAIGRRAFIDGPGEQADALVADE